MKARRTLPPCPDRHLAAAHPRLYFGPEEIEGLRQKRGIDSLAAAAWARVHDLAQAGMELPPLEWQPRWEYDKGESGQESLGGALGKAAHLAGHLAFAALLTGDEQYARKATELMLSVCQMDYWTSPAFFQPPYDPPWRGTLETAGIAQWMGIAYDWLGEALSTEERDRIRLNIAYKGIMPLIQDWADPATRLPIATHIKPWGNWWVNCIAPAGVAALAIYGEEQTVRWETGWPLPRPQVEEEALSARWVRLVKEALEWFWRFEGGSVPHLEKALFWDPEGTYYPANFDREGAYAEGLNYLDGVLINSFRFTEAYLRLLGEETLPLELMRKVADFLLYTCYREGGRMRAVNLDDTRANHATNPQLTAFLAHKLCHPGMQWYLHASQGNFGEDSLFKMGESPVFTFLWYNPNLAPQEPRQPAPVKVYPGTGWGVMRTGWGLTDTCLVIKSGNTAGHTHAVLYPFVEGEAVPEVAVLRERNWIGVRVEREGTTELIAWRGPGARRVGLGGIETDAKLVALVTDREGTVQRCALDRGTFLRVDGRAVPLRRAEGRVAIGGIGNADVEAEK